MPFLRTLNELGEVSIHIGMILRPEQQRWHDIIGIIGIDDLSDHQFGPEPAFALEVFK